MNRVVLIGRVGQDPEARDTRGGRVVNFSLATSEKWKDRETGAQREKVQWHRVTCWNEFVGKTIENYVRKGSQIAVEGSINYDDYEKEGVKCKSTNIVIGRFDGKIELLGSKNDSRGEDRESPQRDERAASGARSEYKSQLDDDIPF